MADDLNTVRAYCGLNLLPDTSRGGSQQISGAQANSRKGTNQMAVSDQYRNQILAAFSSEVYDPNKMDVQHEPLYDTITKAASGTINPASDQFFLNVGPISGKTLAQTNLVQPGQLPSPEAFAIMAIRFRWQENILITDLLNLINSLDLSLVLGQKSYNRALLWFYNVGGGISAVTTNTTSAFYSNGALGRIHAHVLDIPIVIENVMQFKAVFEGTTVTLTAGGSGGTGAILQLLLDGYHARGVQ